MKIVLCATTFLPRLGGLENVADIAASALADRGVAVTVLTREAGPAMPDRKYRLLRQPSFAEAFEVCKAADVAVLLNVGLKMLPAAYLSGTPVVIWHHAEFPRAEPFSRLGPSMVLKSFATRYLCVANIGCSQFTIDTVRSALPKHVIPNPYDCSTMFIDRDVARNGDLLFVGRLVSDKGAAIILEAMARHENLKGARLEIVGEGPEQPILEAKVRELALMQRVRFAGPLRGADLRRAMNANRVLIVPSIVREGFGIVVLEGLACGAEVVTSNAGGLPEALGGCGHIFANGDVDDAARVIAAARCPSVRDPKILAEHLARHSPEAFGATLHAILARY